MASAGTAVFSAVARFGPAVKGAKDLKDALGGVGKGAEDAGKKSQGLVSSFGSKVWSGAKKTVAAGAASAGVAAGALFGTALAKGMGRLTAIDTAQGKLRGLGHDAKSVESIMTDSLASVKGTSYGLEEAATTAAGAVAAGIKPGKELTKYLKIVADTAAIAGIPMAEMGQTMNRVATSGVMMSDDLNMLADKGIPILTWLADEYGVTTQAMKDMVSEGAVDAETYARVLEQNIGATSEGGRAALAMGDTFVGALKNTWAAVGRVGANLLEGVFPYFQKGLNGIMDLLGPIEDGAKSVGEALGKFLAGGIERAGNLFQRIKPYVEGVFNVLTGKGTGLLAKALDVPQDHPAIKVLLSIRDLVTESIPAGFRTLKDIVVGVFNVFTGQGTGLLANALGISQDHWIISTLLAVKDAAGALFDYVRDVAIPALGDFITGFKEGEGAGGLLRSALELAWSAASSLAEGLATSVVPVVRELWEWFTKNQEVIGIAAAMFLGYKGTLLAVAGAKKAVAAAIWLWHAAQKALDLVMKMSTIGLLVAAIAGLVAAIVIAYRTNDEFREKVDKAWAAIKTAISGVVSWFKDTAWPWLRDAMQWIGDKAVWLWKNELQPAWEGIRKAISAVVSWFKDTAWPWMRDAFQWIADKAFWLHERAIKPAFDLIRTAISAVVSWVRDTAWPWMRDAFQNMSDKAGWLRDKVVDAWDRIKSGISAGWDGIKSIFDRFKDGLQALRDKFSDVREGIRRIWDGLSGIIRAPINGVIDVVNGFLRGVYRVLSKIPGVKGKLGAEWGNIAHVSAPRTSSSSAASPRLAMATGGTVPGYSSTDRQDNIPAMLTADEEVIRRRSARKMRRRFPGWMEHVNRHGAPPGYADGGRVGDRRRIGGEGVVEQAKDWLLGLWDDATGWLKNKWSELMPDNFGDSWAGITMKGALGAIDLSGLASWLKEKFVPAGGGGGAHYPGPLGWSPNPMGVGQIIQRILSVVPNALISSTFRPGASTASGVPSLHGLGRAVDWYTPGMVGMVQAFRRVGALAKWSQHFYTPAGASSQHGFVDANIRRDHHDHAHTAMRGGGWVPGTGRGDRTKVLAEPKEFMVNRAAAARWAPLLAAINAGIDSGAAPDLLGLLSVGYGAKVRQVRAMTGVAAGAPRFADSVVDGVRRDDLPPMDMSEESIERLAAALDRHARKVSAKTVADFDLSLTRRNR